MPCCSTSMPRAFRSSRMLAAVLRSALYEVKSAIVRPSAAIAASLTAPSRASWYAHERGSGISLGRHNTAALG